MGALTKIALYGLADFFSLGGWVGAALLLVFAVVLRAAAVKEVRAECSIKM